MAQPLALSRQERRLAAALRLIAARFGPAAVRRLQAAAATRPRDVIPAGALGLDLATGLGGLPRGHLTEFFGTESSGKTTLLYATLAAVQQAGGLAALVDAEGSADPAAMAACGVDLTELLLAQPNSAPDALLLLTILARCRGLDMLGLVSVPALRDLPAGRVRGSAQGDLAAYDVARVLTRGLRVLTAALRDGPTAVIVTNARLPGPPAERTVGGLALRHYAAVRVAVVPQTRFSDAAGGTAGLRVGLTVVKSKVGVPGGTATVELCVGTGVDRAGELLRYGLASGVIVRDRVGLRYQDDVLGHSEAVARRRLVAEPALMVALRTAILAAHQRSAA